MNKGSFNPLVYSLNLNLTSQICTLSYKYFFYSKLRLNCLILEGVQEKLIQVVSTVAALKMHILQLSKLLYL